MGRLLDMLDKYFLGDDSKPDEMLWCLDEAKGFSVNSMCEVLGSSTQTLLKGSVFGIRMSKPKLFFLCGSYGGIGCRRLTI